MTGQEYFGKSNVLKQELKRIIEILDQYAHHRSLSNANDDAPLIAKTRNDLASVLERFENLDREFCSAGESLP
jgi:hypothetical protein